MTSSERVIAILQDGNDMALRDPGAPSVAEVVEVLKTEKPRLLEELKHLSGQFTEDFRLNGGQNLEGLNKRAMEIDRALSLITRLEGA